jgi:photosystem II stability/assembly factor-like uncharacterized protein
LNLDAGKADHRSVKNTLLQIPALLVLTACFRSAGPDLERAPNSPPVLAAQRSGTTALLQAVSAPSARVAWVSGHRGTYAVTTDGGESWRAAVVPDADSLQFRDVYALDERTAWLLAAGDGDRSRIYHTRNGGQSWTLQFRNAEPRAFFDCLDFWDSRRGLAFSDAVDGRFVVLTTSDAGATWTRVPDAALPAARTGEGAFAASGTCVLTGPAGRAWIATGNAPSESRILSTADYGRSWSVFLTPLSAGEGAGAATLAFRDSLHGVAMGGAVGRPNERGDWTAVSGDGGRTWTLGGRPAMAGPVYGVAYVPRTPALVAVGPGGMDWSTDDATSWNRLDTLAYWSVGFSRTGRAGWAVGPSGRITKLTIQ